MATRAPRPDAQRAALLDVNVLVALLDAAFLPFRAARDRRRPSTEIAEVVDTLRARAG
jgi:hypothetical protein